MTYKEWCAIAPRTEEQKRSYRNGLIKQNVLGTAMVILPFLGFLCFTLFPMLLSLVISFSNLQSSNIRLMTFDGVGFKNYIYILKDSWTWYSLRTSCVYSLTTFINIALAVFLANVLNKEIKGQRLWMVLFFLPQVCSSIAISLMWSFMISEEGVINTLIMNLGATEPIKFRTDINVYLPTIFFMSAWMHGTNIVVLLSAFASVNKSLQEAARLDGATEMRVFWKITFPQLTPTIFYMLTMNLVAGLQEQAVFDYLNNVPGPDYFGLSMTLQMYRHKFFHSNFGHSCAMSWLIGFFILGVTRLNFRLSKLWVSYD